VITASDASSTHIRSGNWSLYVQLIVKVLHYRHSVSISNFEYSIPGTLPSQSLDETLSIVVVRTIWSGDLDALKEILET